MPRRNIESEDDDMSELEDFIDHDDDEEPSDFTNASTQEEQSISDDYEEITMEDLDYFGGDAFAQVEDGPRRKRACAVDTEKTKQLISYLESSGSETPEEMQIPKVSTGRRGRPPKLGTDGLPVRRPLTPSVYIPHKEDGMIYVFTTLLANISCRVVAEGRSSNIIDYHESLKFPNNILNDEHVKSSVHLAFMPPKQMSITEQKPVVVPPVLSHGVKGVGASIPMMPTLPQYRVSYIRPTNPIPVGTSGYTNFQPSGQTRGYLNDHPQMPRAMLVAPHQSVPIRQPYKEELVSSRLPQTSKLQAEYPRIEEPCNKKEKDKENKGEQLAAAREPTSDFMQN